MSGVHKYRAVGDVSGTITYEDWTADSTLSANSYEFQSIKIAISLNVYP
jgi:hypothetical protein